MKTTSRHFFGIDLGTSSCSIAYVADDPRQRNAQLVSVQTVDVAVEADGAHLITNRIPSVVAAPLDPKARGGALFGLDFFAAFGKKKKEAGLLRRGRDYFASVKSDLGTLRAYTRSRVPGCRTPAEVTAIILERLRGLAHDANPALDPRQALEQLLFVVRVAPRGRHARNRNIPLAGMRYVCLDTPRRY